MRPIVCTSDVCGGRPRIDGTRLTCANVVLSLTLAQISPDEFFDINDNLTKADVVNCLSYCKEQKCLLDKPQKFCQGCSLDTSDEELPAYVLNDAGELERNPDGKEHVYFGTLAEYFEKNSGNDCWKLASSALDRISEWGDLGT